MKTIAKRGTETLALADDKADLNDPRLEVMLKDTRTGKKTGPFLWQSLLARGYWEPVETNGEES
jgi:hypothetical protein